jgi:transketolase
MKNIDYANALRILSIDAIQKANSGHPGAPMGMADIAEVLWRSHLKHNPTNPHWLNRDRFVLSNGHASMLLYALLHLTGYDLSLEDIKQFRQLHAKTAGHPEYAHVDGVETTTGPLGQGLANAVGMAIAEKSLASQFNKEGFNLIDHFTYAFVGDGCLMEGISHEVASFAGTHKLGKLIVFYDDNGISIDGDISQWFTDDTPSRFEAYGWHVIPVVDGHDPKAIDTAIKDAQKVTDKPTLICCQTVIGFGSPNKKGDASSHGAPLGDDEIELTRKELGWAYEERFFVPQELYDGWNAVDSGATLEKKWNEMFDSYAKAYPQEAKELQRRLSHTLPEGWETSYDEMVASWQKEGVKVATRKASEMVLDHVGKVMPELLGGSADLAPSNLTKHTSSKNITPDDASGNYLHYGVREFGMSAMMNGIYLHGGFKPYGGTFLIFMEYARNAVRMAALMGLPVTYVYTHDSIGLGEDGPTHQPVEQGSMLRLTPNVETWRPADAVETAIAWKSALKRTDGPTALLLSRQGLAMQERDEQMLLNAAKGGYVIFQHGSGEDLILIATGSEVALAIEAAKKLASESVNVRVVSLPSTEVFDKQETSYKESVLPSKVTKRIAVEAGIPDYWYKYTGLEGKIIGMNTFGLSGPEKELYDYFGITADAVYSSAKELLS